MAGPGQMDVGRHALHLWGLATDSTSNSVPAAAPRVLVTGGAGFLGINLLRYLHGRGYATTSLDIAPFGYPDMEPHVRVVQGDIRIRRDVDTALEGCRYVVHCAAALPLYPPEDIHTTDVVGTRIVFEASRDHGIERAVHISSTAVYGIPDHHPLKEDDRLHGVGPYGIAKVAAEAEAGAVPRRRPRRARCCGPSRSSARSGSASSPCSTTGRSTSATSR